MRKRWLVKYVVQAAIALVAVALSVWVMWPILVFQVRCVLERVCP